jgi:hypothetical protein
MSHATLPISFWRYTLERVAYIVNLVPSKSIPRIPYEVWIGLKPSSNHRKVWGCLVYMLTKGSKLKPRLELCYFVRHPKGTRGGYFYHPQKHKVLVSTHARYLEGEQSVSSKVSSKVELEEKLSSTSTFNTPIRETKETQPYVPIRTEPRHSGRISRVLE